MARSRNTRTPRLNLEHIRSYEALSHIHCGNCRAYWSLSGDGPIEALTCPFCSTRAPVVDDPDNPRWGGDLDGEAPPNGDDSDDDDTF